MRAPVHPARRAHKSRNVACPAIRSGCLLEQHHASCRERSCDGPRRLRFAPAIRRSKRRLTGAVAPDERQSVAWLDVEIEVAEQPARSLDEAEIFVGENRCRHATWNRALWRGRSIHGLFKAGYPYATPHVSDDSRLALHAVAACDPQRRRGAGAAAVALALRPPPSPTSSRSGENAASHLRRADQQAAFDQMREGRIRPLREIESNVVPRMSGADYLGSRVRFGLRHLSAEVHAQRIGDLGRCRRANRGDPRPVRRMTLA